MWKEMRKGKCKTKRTSEGIFFFLCTLNLQDGRGEEYSKRKLLKRRDEKENMKIRMEKQERQRREKARNEAMLERKGKVGVMVIGGF